MKLAPATPALPVRNVIAAQEYYRDTLGFQIAWYNESGDIGGVNHGDCAIFLRGSQDPIVPVVLWIFVAEVDAAHDTLSEKGAQITEPLADMPWGLRQFTVQDCDGHRLTFFCD